MKFPLKTHCIHIRLDRSEAALLGAKEVESASDAKHEFGPIALYWPQAAESAVPNERIRCRNGDHILRRLRPRQIRTRSRTAARDLHL